MTNPLKKIFKYASPSSNFKKNTHYLIVITFVPKSASFLYSQIIEALCTHNNNNTFIPIPSLLLLLMTKFKQSIKVKFLIERVQY